MQKPFIIALSIVLVVVIGSIAYFYIINEEPESIISENSNLTINTNTSATNTNTQQEQTETEMTENTESLAGIYYIDQDLQDNRIRKSTVYKINTNINEDDEVVYKFEYDGYNHYDKISAYLKPYQILYNSSESVYYFDIENQTINKIFDLPTEVKEANPEYENIGIRNVLLSNDQKQLAYTVSGGIEGGDGQLWIYDILQDTHQRTTDMLSVGIFGSMRVENWTTDDQGIILRGSGGDAGAIWGDVYYKNLNDNTTTLEPIEVADEDKRNFILGSVSPDGKYWTYKKCESPQTDPESEIVPRYLCPEGEELYLYDFTTQEHTSIYQNTEYDNNVYKDYLRNNHSFYWVDDNNIVLANLAGIYNIEVASGTVTQIYETYHTNPKESASETITINFANDDYILWNGKILDRKTKKILQYDRRNTTFIPDWLFEIE